MGTPQRRHDRVRPFLTNSTFLGSLPAAAIDTLVGKGQVRSFGKGAAIYRRGDPGDSLMLVVNGRVKLANTSVHGKEVVHYYVGEGEIFGEVAALDGKARAADSVASEDSDIFVIATRDLLPILKVHPDAMFAVVRALCEKIRIAAAIIEDNTLDMQGRAARGLLRLARRHGRKEERGAALQLTISQEELGKYFGMSRANVNRQLGQLKNANVIRISGTAISIIDEKALAELADAREVS